MNMTLLSEEEKSASVGLSVPEDDRKSKSPRSKTMVVSRKSQRQEQLEIEREEKVKTRYFEL